MLKPREQKLVDEWPAIQWTEPLPVRVPESGLFGLGCRFCIAFYGLKGYNVGKLPQTQEQFDAHMKGHSMAQ